MTATFPDEHLLVEAFYRVKENQGCAGVDGISITCFEKDLAANIRKLVDDLSGNSYFPLPFLKIIVEKGNGEPRGLCVPAVRDRIAQTAVLTLIGPMLEREFEDCSYAYRKGKSVRQAVYKIKEYRDAGFRWVVDADIDAFFDSVDHNLMLGKVRKLIKDDRLIKLITAWIKCEIWDGKSLETLTKGIPQGSPLSPVMANLFLDELDEALLRRNYRYIRYADDFVVLCKSRAQAEQALELTDAVLEKLLLTLDERDIRSFDDGFTYLGVTFLKSLITVPFEKAIRQRKILYYPPPMNIGVYMLKKAKGW